MLRKSKKKVSYNRLDNIYKSITNLSSLLAGCNFISLGLAYTPAFTQNHQPAYARTSKPVRYYAAIAID